MSVRAGNHGHTHCRERDQIILAFALAANERNIAVGDMESAGTDAERQSAQASVDMAAGYCHHLRDLVLRHCKQHGC